MKTPQNIENCYVNGWFVGAVTGVYITDDFGTLVLLTSGEVCSGALFLHIDHYEV